VISLVQVNGACLGFFLICVSGAWKDQAFGLKLSFQALEKTSGLDPSPLVWEKKKKKKPSR